ncbi:hypothetical protein THRCLA_09879 [Thraustotheca clavata]|uniref:Cyclic nucleotide-binding domain-containing protein n=1 Tax=Thraustotheca clavata TaxID=74557 RepID=A0A1V9YTT9_9STRA|nr:hypothetical protein THRCLA_09879 [Thraustotheca clavata]
MNQARASIRNCAQSLQARFALRKMLMRRQDLSQQQLEFVVKYLTQETTIYRFGWWQLLTHTEKLALAQEVKLVTIEKGCQNVILTGHANEAFVLLRGRAECYLLETQLSRPVMNSDGFVFGNLKITNTTYSEEDPVGWATESNQNHLCLYKKVIVLGPADYIIITANFTINGAVQKVANITNNNSIQSFGLDPLAPFVRMHTYDAGSIIVQQGNEKSFVCIITKGTCKATYMESNEALNKLSFLNAHNNGVDVALLGPQSYVGDIATMFDMPEPVTVTCLSDVDVVYFNLQDLYEVLKVSDDTKRRMAVVAHQTLSFILERLDFLLGDKVTKTSPNCIELSKQLSQHPLPYLPPLEEHTRPQSASNEVVKEPPISKPRTAPKENTPRTQLLNDFKPTNTNNVQPIEPTRDLILAMHSMHSNLRKNTLASHGLRIVSPEKEISCESTLQQNKPLFLCPTMTKQRQYHGRTLPLIEKCNGVISMK